MIGELSRRMAGLGLSLDAAQVEPTGKVDKRYEASRIGTGHVKAATYDREERRRIERTIKPISKLFAHS